MNRNERNYLELSLKKLEAVLPKPIESLMRHWEQDETAWAVETINDLVFCRFSFPVIKDLEQVILLVYDRKKRIIADAGAYHTDTASFLERKDIYDYLSEESDWMYLEHYVLSGTMFPNLPYPFCGQNRPSGETGDVFLYTNAYVSKAFRRMGIFRSMLENMTEHALQNADGIHTLYSVMSMDPDIACYGPDASDEPYYYSYETDEPIRIINAEIARHTGFMPLRLEPDDPSSETDGTKLWFCVRKEIIEIIEEQPA